MNGADVSPLSHKASTVLVPPGLHMCPETKSERLWNCLRTKNSIGDRLCLRGPLLTEGLVQFDTRSFLYATPVPPVFSGVRWALSWGADTLCVVSRVCEALVSLAVYDKLLNLQANYSQPTLKIPKDKLKGIVKCSRALKFCIRFVISYTNFPPS